ncbi:MAG: hypothetical protein MI807_07950, partial [Verrucomicrobiales bacterium]|nr:hypothetical protein [Verrucomicrobiales bacterium]
NMKNHAWQEPFLRLWEGVLPFLKFLDNSSFFPALLGAAFGAFAAYWFSQVHERKKENERRKAALKRAQLVLIFQNGTLENLKRGFVQFLAPMEDGVFQFVRYSQTRADERIDFDSVSFLLSQGNPNILQDLYYAEKSFEGAIATLDQRNQMLSEIEQSPGTKIGLMDQESGMVNIEMKSHHAKALNDVTKSLVSCVKSAIKNNKAVQDTLFKEAKRLFPKSEFLKSSPKPTKSIAIALASSHEQSLVDTFHEFGVKTEIQTPAPGIVTASGQNLKVLPEASDSVGEVLAAWMKKGADRNVFATLDDGTTKRLRGSTAEEIQSLVEESTLNVAINPQKV